MLKKLFISANRWFKLALIDQYSPLLPAAEQFSSSV
jgi:hypothetical protein